MDTDEKNKCIIITIIMRCTTAADQGTIAILNRKKEGGCSVTSYSYS